MDDYFFPCLFLIPEQGMTDVQRRPYSFLIRRWDVSIFDLATLQSKHDLHVSHELMNVFLGNCNSEIRVAADSVQEATDKVQLLRAMLYLRGITPFVLPFISSHSINEYAGINSRDSDYMRGGLPSGLQQGITSKTSKVEAWPLELSFQSICVGKKTINSSVFEDACGMVAKWEPLVTQHPPLRAVQSTLIAAPKLGDLSQSILHVWTAIEALFPRVNSEVTFTVALYLTQLNLRESDRVGYFAKVRKAYGTRSKIAHGAGSDVSTGDWETAWSMLCNACVAILEREKLPSETELLEELLAHPRTC